MNEPRKLLTQPQFDNVDTGLKNLAEVVDQTRRHLAGSSTGTLQRRVESLRSILNYIEAQVQ